MVVPGAPGWGSSAGGVKRLRWLAARVRPGRRSRLPPKVNGQCEPAVPLGSCCWERSQHPASTRDAALSTQHRAPSTQHPSSAPDTAPQPQPPAPQYSHGCPVPPPARLPGPGSAPSGQAGNRVCPLPVPGSTRPRYREKLRATPLSLPGRCRSHSPAGPQGRPAAASWRRRRRRRRPRRSGRGGRAMRPVPDRKTSAAPAVVKPDRKSVV